MSSTSFDEKCAPAANNSRLRVARRRERLERLDPDRARRSHASASRHAVPSFIEQRAGVVVEPLQDTVVGTAGAFDADVARCLLEHDRPGRRREPNAMLEQPVDCEFELVMAQEDLTAFLCKRLRRDVLQVRCRELLRLSTPETDVRRARASPGAAMRDVACLPKSTRARVNRGRTKRCPMNATDG